MNALSLAVALISNLSLLLNMARRLPFPIAQPITVGGWYISSILLICLTAIMPRTVDMEGLELTQGYYYAIMASAVYFFISSLMMVTIYGARTYHYPRGFYLTSSQRSVMLQTIIYMVYLLLGALVYSHVEQWRYLDAVYWADFTILTTGIGDLAPATHLGRGLLFPYAIGGILTLALIIRSIHSLMVERGKSKLAARSTEKFRMFVATRLRKGQGTRYGFFFLQARPHNPDDSESQRQRHEFHLMRAIHKAAAWQLRWVSFFTALLLWTTLWMLGALAFFMAEDRQHWSYFLALYFAYTSLLTIGYGDVAPGQTWGKPFYVLWSLLAIPTMTILLSSMGDTVANLFDELVIVAGELTVLPGDKSIRHRFLEIVLSWTKSVRHPEFGRAATRAVPSSTMTMETAVNVGDVEHGYTSEKASFEHEGQAVPQNPSRRQHLLIREIKKLHGDLNASPPKQYTYAEWLFYLRLIGWLDSCSSYPNIPPGEAEDAPAPDRIIGLRKVPRDGTAQKKWSWIGMRSPLMGDKNEAEWLCEALVHILELELRVQSEQSRLVESEERACEDNNTSKEAGLADEPSENTHIN